MEAMLPAPGLTGETLRFGKDEAIFNAGDPANKMYVLLKGQVEIRVAGKVVDVVHQGGIFGELGIIDPGPRSASAVALAESELLGISEQQLLKLVETTPFFAIKLLRLVASRFRRANAMQNALL